MATNKQDTELIVKHYRAQKAHGEKELIVERVGSDSETAQFLQRVEAARLNKPHTGAIDMRDKVLWDCKAYQHNNKTHYFDDISLEIFKEEVKRNNGTLTVGGYEKILYGDHTMETRTIRPVDRLQGYTPPVKKSQPTVDKTEETKPQTESPPVEDNIDTENNKDVIYNYGSGHTPEPLDFTYYYERVEPRLQYKMNIIAQSDASTLNGITRDISQHGMRFKFPTDEEIDFRVDTIVSISFPSLKNKDSRFGELLVNYRIVMLGMEEEQTLVSCELIEDDNTQWVSDFFHQFIETEKLRYKLDPEDETLTRTALCYQEVYNHSLTNIPLFFINKGEHTYLESLGITENNKPLLELFTQSEKELSALRIPSRIQHLTSFNENEEKKKSLLVCYKDKSKLYSATNFEINNADDFNSLIEYARKKSIYRIFKLDTQKIEKGISEKALTDFTERLKEKSEEDHRELVDEISNLHAVGLLTDITYLFPSNKHGIYDNDDEDNTPNNLSVWCDDKQINLIEKGNVADSCDLTSSPNLLTLEHIAARREPRFLARTKVEIEINGERIATTSRDLSVRGLRIELEESVNLHIGDSVKIGFLSFKQKRSGFDIKNIAYKVVNITQEDKLSVISFSREIGDDWNLVTNFFEDIIEVNKNKLRLCLNDVITASKVSAYEHLYNKHLTSHPFFVSQNSKGGVRLERCVLPYEHSGIAQFFKNENNQFDLTPLSAPGLVKTIHHTVNAQIKTDHLELYFFKDMDQEGNIVYQHATNHSLTKEADRRLFVQKCMEKAEYIFLKMSAAETKPHYNFLEEQTGFLRDISKHHATKLYQELETIIGYGELIDITQEVILSLKFTQAVKK